MLLPLSLTDALNPHTVHAFSRTTIGRGPHYPGRARPDPFAEQVTDWPELLFWNISTAASTTETFTSRLIYGDFILDYITAVSSTLNVNSLVLAVGLADDDTGGATIRDVSNPVARERIGDTNTFPILLTVGPQVPFLTPLGTVRRGPTSRIILSYLNGSAASGTSNGTIRIIHLRPKDQDHRPYI